MASSTIFKNFTVPVEKKSLLLIANDIASGKYKAEVEEIRALLEQGKTEEAANKKKQLLAFTPSAVFSEKRQMPFLEMYSGFVHLDFDKLTPEQLDAAFKVIAEIPYTFLCFISPSGNGLKVFIEVNTEIEHHDIAYLQVQKHYEEATGLKADPSCKDITRLCFMSYHPGLFKNIRNEKFKVQLPEIFTQPDAQPKAQPVIPPVQEEPEEDLNIAFIFNQQIQFTNQKTQYTDGNRNNYIYRLASNCNRAGLSQSDTELLCTQHFDLPEREIKEAVKSAYTHHSGEFAKFANTAKLQPAKQLQPLPEEDPLEDYLKTTPTIPDAVYDALPLLLKDGARAFTDKRKRDVFFTGAISIISGCLPNVTGVYFQERVYPHLYTFIIAPAASGKGVLKNAKRLADKYHQKILQQSRDAQKIHDNEMSDFKQLERSRKKGEPSPEKPKAPPFKIIFIPADCSKARMIEHLKANDGQGIICETEADTMSGAKKQDWGDYSTILRAAFHHETVSSTRKTDNQYDEINEPRLAVALSGTPAQAPRLLSSAEDGLFSRFLFYAYKNCIEWQDPSPKSNGVVYNDHFEALSVQVLELISLLELSPTTVELTEEQWQRINTDFPVMLSEVVTFTSEDAAGVVYRLGLIFFRLCMIFSALRKFENGEMSSTIICTDEDFNTVMQIVQTYLDHSLLMFNNLPKQNEPMQFQSGDGKRRFFEALPQEFTRKEATEIGTKFKLSARTVDDVLKSATGVSLTRIKAGHYQRI
ncbi:MAG: DUF3987 domain-containing protein [Bacteroidia bacterium]